MLFRLTRTLWYKKISRVAFTSKRAMLIVMFFLTIVLTIVISLNPSVALSYVATLSWNVPTKNSDGSPLTDLAGYRIYFGTSSGNYSRKIDVGNVTTYTVNNLEIGVRHYFAITAYDTSGNESRYSNEVSIARYSLVVGKSGMGKGTVVSSPAGINCGSDCSEAYKAGTVVTLTAIPETGSTFNSWSGSWCTGNGQCILTINANTTVTANFNATTSVTIISPNGGEVLKSGSIHTITWKTNETIRPAAYIKIFGTGNGGTTWKMIAALQGNPGSYDWKIPLLTTAKIRCKVGVVLLDSSGQRVGVDISDSFFTVQP